MASMNVIEFFSSHHLLRELVRRKCGMTLGVEVKASRGVDSTEHSYTRSVPSAHPTKIRSPFGDEVMLSAFELKSLPTTECVKTRWLIGVSVAQCGVPPLCSRWRSFFYSFRRRSYMFIKTQNSSPRDTTRHDTTKQNSTKEDTIPGILVREEIAREEGQE